MNERSNLLAEASHHVNGDRAEHYGEPADNFARIARLWTAYLNNRPADKPLTEADVALMQILGKAARLQHDQAHRDGWVDIAGYAATGGEVATSRTTSAPHGARVGVVAL